MLTVERLREVLHYSPTTGLFFWLCSPNNSIRIGQQAGSVRKDGYREIGIDGKVYQASRLACLYMTGEWPSKEVDHHDRNRDNNRWINLRDATVAENQWNAAREKHNTSGFKGVYYVGPRRQWMARISVNSHRRFLGLYPTAEAAYAAYCVAAKEYHGRFARIA